MVRWPSFLSMLRQVFRKFFFRNVKPAANSFVVVNVLISFLSMSTPHRRRSRRLAAAGAAPSPNTPPPARLLDLPTDLLERVLSRCDSPVDIARAAAVSLVVDTSADKIAAEEAGAAGAAVHGAMPLFVACQSNHLECVRLLPEASATDADDASVDRRAANKDRSTPP